MINKIVPTDEKLKLVHRFYTDFWGTEVIKDSRPEPPTVEQMQEKIRTSTFPGLELLTVEDHWMKARKYYAIYGGETELLEMVGDPPPGEEEKQFFKTIENENRFFELMDKQAYTDPFFIEYEKKHGKFCRYPIPIETKYTGVVRDFDDDSLILLGEGKERAFCIDGINLEKFDLTRPLTVVTTKFTRPDKSETDEKVCRIEQA